MTQDISKALVVYGVLAGLLLLSQEFFANHGTRVSYDWTNTIRVSGVVNEFVTRNPHSFLMFDVKARASVMPTCMRTSVVMESC
jgi:hypothetical protein